MGCKYSRKEHKNYSVRKACWILPLLWGQIFIWSQLELCQFTAAQELPTHRPVLGLDSSSFWKVFHAFYPVNPPPGQPVLWVAVLGAGRFVIRQNCSVLMSFAPRKKKEKHEVDIETVSSKLRNGRNCLDYWFLLEGIGHKSRVSIPKVMGMHFSQANLSLGLYVVLRASFLSLTRCFSSEGVHS